MTSVLNIGNSYNNSTNPVIVDNVPKNAVKLSFKAGENDKFSRQSAPQQRVQQAPMMDSYARALAEQRKKEKQQKTKNNLITGLSIAGTLVMLIYFGRHLIKDIKFDKLAKQSKNAGDPTGAQQELGVKTKEELQNLFIDVSKEKSFEDIKMSGTLKNQLQSIMDKLKNPDKYTEAMQELEQMYIFYGPPGTGKTTFVNAICKEFGIKPFKYDMGILKGGFQGTTENNMTRVNSVFLEKHRAERAKNPNHISVMFFDECDEVFLETTGPNKDTNNQIMSRFKQYLNEWREEPGVLVFCCTNKHPAELNEAIRNRGTTVFIDNPVAEALSDNFFAHFAPAKEGKIAKNLKNPTEKSKKFFEIIQAKDHRDFAYRDLQRIGWRSTEELPKDRPLELNDIIQRTINGDFGMNESEIKQLKELLTKDDNLISIK